MATYLSTNLQFFLLPQRCLFRTKSLFVESNNHTRKYRKIGQFLVLVVKYYGDHLIWCC